MLERFKWLVKLAVSRSYIIMTDKEAGMHLKLVKRDAFTNILLLSVQMATLREFRAHIDGLIHEHEERAEEIAKEN